MTARTWTTLADLVRDPSLLTDGEVAPSRATVTRAKPFDARRESDEAASSSSRRGLLQGLGGLFAASALTACSRAPRERILPYTKTPPELVPGVPTTYATSIDRDGYARGVLVQMYDGRPVKIEGNPDHPASLGSTSAQEQAEIWRLYDPDRAREVLAAGQPASLLAMLRELEIRLAARRSGRGVHVLLPATSSRLVAEALATLRAAMPDVSVHFASFASPRETWEAGALLYGQARELDVDLAGAKVIVAFDADLVQSGPAALVHQRHFAEGRTLGGGRSGGTGMNRLYVVEPELTVTGSNADHRLAVRRAQVPGLVAFLALALARAGGGSFALPPELAAALEPLAIAAGGERRFLEALARDLLANRAAAVLAIGPTQPAVIQALGHLLGRMLGARSVARVSSIVEAGQPSHSLSALTAAITAKHVDTLLVLGGNPAYASPRQSGFAAALASVPFSLHLAAYVDETAAACRWVVPAAHPFESWRDGHAFDGTWTIAQPVLRPLTEGRTEVEMLAALGALATGAATSMTLANAIVGDGAASPAHDRLRELAGDGWSEARIRGIASGPRALDVAPVSLDRVRDLARALAAGPRPPAPPPADTFELSTPLDSRIHDGALANCPWLQELPDPLTKLTWGNAALLAPGTGARLGLADGDVVTLSVGDTSLDAPVRLAPGQALDVVTLPLGFGRRGGESVARDVGVNAFLLATPVGSPAGQRLTLRKTGRTSELASTQAHFALEGRDDSVVPELKLADLGSPEGPWPRGAEARGEMETLFVLKPGAARQWGMLVDLNACTGCNACVVACQVENNVPTVGKSGVRKGREMHWLRIDRYFRGPADAPETIAQPMLCQHCEKAPCEYVCPVGATNHSSEGLNQMVYNRCVGTRFCSNNCPYKVRRFNWFDYHDDEPDLLRLGRNPDVTVRARGVMEKCTFCVQRIRRTEQTAETQGRDERVDEFTSACAQVCPSRAITFGDLSRSGSAVSRRWNEPRAYAVLNELGTEPRVRYAARVRNPNPELAT